MKECPWRVKISYLLTAGFIGLVVAPFLLLVLFLGIQDGWKDIKRLLFFALF